MKFKTSLPLTLLLASLAVTFGYLSVWQLQRAEAKRFAQKAFDNAGMVSRLVPTLPDWTRIRLTGEYDQQRHLLLDNKLFEGRAGVHVLTPLRLPDQEQWLLVNRGWLPLSADRRLLSPVTTPEGRVTLSGRLAPISRPGVQIGDPADLQAGKWPQFMVYPDWSRMERALDQPLHRQVLYLDRDQATGFEDRNWTPFTMGPDRHKAYAVQWLGLALTALIIWLLLGVRAGSKAAS